MQLWLGFFTVCVYRQVVASLCMMLTIASVKNEMAKWQKLLKDREYESCNISSSKYSNNSTQVNAQTKLYITLNSLWLGFIGTT